MIGRVRTIRGGTAESVHRVHVAVVDARGRLEASAGEPERVAFYRSSAKPFQALPLVEEGVADLLGLDEAELAVCCASHNSEPEHLERVRAVLTKAGLGPGALECGPHRPLSEEVAEAMCRDGIAPTSLHSNCSGKHAGMLAFAVGKGWTTEGYVKAGHPVQRRMLAEVRRWTGLSGGAVRTGTDGCGVVTFAVPLKAMAASFARLAEASAEGEEGPARIVAAMTGHPFLVAGSGRLDTALMELAGDRLFSKAGAEGVHCVGLPNRGLGVALKVEDGAGRAADPGILRVLEALDLLEPGELEALVRFRRPRIRNTRGEEVGHLETEIELERHA